MLKNTQHIDIKHLSAYAEDPRSYCYYKGIPRSVHNKTNLKNKVTKINPLSSSFSRNSLYLAILSLMFSVTGLYVFLNMPMSIFGITYEKDTILYISIGSFLATITLFLGRSFLIRRSIFKFCGVPTSSYRLLGTNLTRSKRSISLKKDKLYGNPDTVFLKKNAKSAYVCQYNPRKFNGRAKVRERYQMLIFMGIIMEQHKLENIKGAIRYQDHLEFIKYEPVIYKKLIALQGEYNKAIQEWVAPDDQPLFKRDKAF